MINWNEIKQIESGLKLIDPRIPIHPDYFLSKIELLLSALEEVRSDCMKAQDERNYFRQTMAEHLSKCRGVSIGNEQ